MKTFRLIGMALFAVLVSVGFTSCSNDDDDDNGGTTSGKRLVKMTVQGESKTYTYDYSYDSQGRVVRKEVKRNGNIDHYYVYSYMDNLIVQKYYYGNSANRETKYTLENGLIVSKKEQYEIRYTYENGYLATKTDENDVYKYKWNNGNLTSIELQSGGHLHKQNYEYTSYAAPQGFVIDIYVEEDLGKFFGKSSRNLPSKFTEVNNDGEISEQITYDWTLKDGLPIKLVVMEKDGGGIYTTTHTYEWQ